MHSHHGEGAGMGGHHHGGGDARALKITSWLTGIYFLVELAIGIYTGSVAVLSDAAHTFSAVGGVLLALVASRVAARPADAANSFGMKRAEILGALLNGVFLLAMAVMVIAMGAFRLSDPKELATIPMFAAAAGGLVIEVYSLRLLYQAQKNNLNMKGAYWHVVQTFVGSLIIVVSAAVIEFTGFVEIDPILGMAFGFVLLWASWGIIRGSLGYLMEQVPSGVDLSAVKRTLEGLPGVVDAHHIHAWALTSGMNIFSTHVTAEDAADHQDVLERAHRAINGNGRFYFATVQVEKAHVDTPGADAIDITGRHGDATATAHAGHGDHDLHHA